MVYLVILVYCQHLAFCSPRQACKQTGQEEREFMPQSVAVFHVDWNF